MDAASRVIEPWRALVSPRFLETDRIPRDRPVMFVSNHTIMGMIDTPLLFLGIYEHTGKLPRSMADHIHYRVPGWRDVLTRFGAVPGTRENCRAVMREGSSLLVFPGGGREVFKSKGESYTLIWGKRAGFARLAREFGYPIVPVASVGAEECYRILFDQHDLLRSPVGSVVKSVSPRQDVVFPTLVSGLAGTPFPKPQRFYFLFGDPIESTPNRGAEGEEEAIFALREEVRVTLEGLIEETLAVRERDKERTLTARALKWLTSRRGFQ